MVEHSTLNLKTKGSNPSTGIKKICYNLVGIVSTLVEHLTHHPKVKGSNLANGIKQVLIKFGCALEAQSTLNPMIEGSNFRRNKMAKKFCQDYLEKKELLAQVCFYQFGRAQRRN